VHTSRGAVGGCSSQVLLGAHGNKVGGGAPEWCPEAVTVGNQHSVRMPPSRPAVACSQAASSLARLHDSTSQAALTAGTARLQHSMPHGQVHVLIPPVPSCTDHCQYRWR
jgi:hypothetical protein